MAKFSKDLVSYKNIGSRMEYTIENNLIVVRATGYTSSMRSITQFLIEEKHDGRYPEYFLSFFLNQDFDEKMKPQLQYTVWEDIVLNV